MEADPLPLAQDLIRCPSVTPAEAGALELVSQALRRLGFRTNRLRFGEVENLYARLGDRAPNFCFAGHSDVVPPGDLSAWSADPFGAEIRDGFLYGRGAADMKTAIAAMVSAVENFLAGRRASGFAGSISFLITGDEEGPAIHGTRQTLAEIARQGERLDHCIVGEPTSHGRVGDTIKNGRRGSLNAHIVVRGIQGHVAYPEEANNPLPALLDLLAVLRARKLDVGSPGFQPSNLEITTIDAGNPAHNVIPASAEAKLNIRFNPAHKGGALEEWLEREAQEAAARTGARIETRIAVTGEAFRTEPGPFTALVAAAAQAVTGYAPQFSTDGGTSDARFIKDHCPVVELGLQNATAHKVDERVRVDDVTTLARIYATVLESYFS
jgi:succinyl-diaminopimelate desuccinylase